jgi:hypothetical protein
MPNGAVKADEAAALGQEVSDFLVVEQEHPGKQPPPVSAVA